MRTVLEGLESKDQERTWVKNTSVGDLDDAKLIDGLTGERNIYMRRKDMDPDSPFFQPKPKKLSFVFDVSLSMSRYASDGRLERSLEAAVMVMEALKGFERKFEYRISGHSGVTDELLLVPWNKPPSTDKGRLDVIKAMHAHCEMADSGDNTLEAARKAVFDCAAGIADERFVFLISDANLDQYSITPDHLQRIFDLDRRVHVFVLFIASLRDSAVTFAKQLPGNVFVCLDKKDLPRVLKRYAFFFSFLLSMTDAYKLTLVGLVECLWRRRLQTGYREEEIVVFVALKEKKKRYWCLCPQNTK